jgi:hypothetical protein
VNHLKGTLPPPHVSSTLLLGIGLVAGVIGLGFVIWLVGRAIGAIADGVAGRPRIPRARTTYTIFSALCLLSFVLAIASMNLARLIYTHARVGEATRIGDLRCEALADGLVRTTFSSVSPHPVASESVAEQAPSCRIEASVMTMRQLPARLGISAVLRITQVGHKELPAEEPTWWNSKLGLFPLKLLMRGSSSTEATTAPDGAAVWAVVATPTGLLLQRSGGV